MPDTAGANDYVSVLGPNWEKELDTAEKRVDDIVKKIAGISAQSRGTETQLIDASSYANAVKLTQQLAEAERKLATEATKAARLQEQLNQRRTEARSAAAALTQANERLARAQSAEGRELALVAEQTRRANAENRALAQGSLAAEGSLESMRAELRILTLDFDALSESERTASQAGVMMQTRINELTQGLTEADEATGRFGRGVGDYPQTFSAAVQALQAARTELAAQLTQVEEGSDAYRVLSTQIERLDTVLDSNTTRVIGSRQAARELREVSLELADTLGVQSTAFRNVTDVAGGLTDAIGDTQSVINRAASDTRDFDEVLGAAQGIAGTFGVAEGAAVLFGASQEDVQKSQERLMAVMTVLQSLQEVQNALQSESAAMAFVATVKQKALAVVLGIKNLVLTGNIAGTTADTVAVGANTTATNLQTAATVRSTLAMRALRIALIASGIGLIVVALLAAANAMGVFGDSAADAAEETANLTKESEDLAAALDKVSKASEKTRNSRAGGLDEQRRELELMKAKGASLIDIYNQEQKIARMELSNARVSAFTIQSQIADNQKKGIASEALQEQLSDLNKAGLDAANDIEIRRQAFLTAQREKAAAEGEKAREKQLKSGEEARKKQEDYDKRELKAQGEILQLKKRMELNALKEVAEDEGGNLTTRLEASSLFFLKQIEAARLKADIEIKESEKTKSELVLIEAAYEEEKYTITQEAFKRRMELVNANVDAEIEIRQAGLERINENSANGSYDALSPLTAQLGAGVITVEEYEKQKADIQFAFEQQRLRDTIAFLKEQEEEVRAAGKNTLDIQKAINEAEARLREGNLQDFLSAQEKKKEKQLEIISQIQGYVGVANNLLSIEKIKSDERIAQLDKEKEAIGARYDKEIEGIQNSLLSEEDKALKLAELNAKKQQEQAAIDAKQKEEKTRQAQFEKELTIANIIINTAALVISEYLKGSFPAAIAAGISGAAQLAVAIATPIPQYKMGIESTPADGPAILGDGNRKEVVRTPDGQVFTTPDRATLFPFLAKGTRVFPSIQDYVRSQQQDGTASTVIIPLPAVMPGNQDAEDRAMARQTAAIVGAIKGQRPFVIKGYSRDFEDFYKRRTG